jgi:transcriptional regulator with XRE-family HTH domain
MEKAKKVTQKSRFNGLFLKASRENQGMKQDYVAYELGISPSNLSRIENGRLEPTFSMVVKCSELLMIKVFDLML